ncbi:class I SAM-dependent methyltransferase [Zoogloea sp.]|uniref:class I SAM-dependent methyltransferase n=1 Tax=Zoogloea sp. TaxID=49181 RepID=UPI001416AABF|nr:MAG: class I SAM-dependent methyltransferase [Zoogloea sp.]
MKAALLHRLVDQASAPYRPAGPWAWHFARGKLKGDPLFPALLEPGLLPAAGRYLDLGCGQGLLASWLLAAAGTPPHSPAAGVAHPLPRMLAYHGVDMQAHSIAHARQALAGSPLPVKLEADDMCAAALPPADVVTLFDVLHYVPPAAQEALLHRIRTALPGDGRLLMRVGDAAAGLPHHLSRLVDSLVVLGHGGGWPRLHCRSAAGWCALLRELGFSTEIRDMPGAGFANVLILARPTSNPTS